MKVLGIVCSARKMGNSEILAKHVLRHCRNKGADVRLLRLNDWKLSECEGCFGCLFKNKECTIKDDMRAFANTVLYDYDRILVSAPTYLLFPPGIVKVIIDRVGVFVQQAQTTQPKPKFGAIIGVAGVKGWDYFTMPMLLMMIKVIAAYQIDIVDRVLLHHPGPGEVLLAGDELTRVELLADRLMAGESAAQDEVEKEGITCPVCHSNSFIIKQEERMVLECPFCRVTGSMGEAGVAEWDSLSMDHHRFTENAGKEFVESWILKTRPFFKNQLTTILLHKQVYKDSKINMEWETP